jgi:hypothetical protein
MSKNFPKTGKKTRPKTAAKGKRFLCAKCRKRSPKPVTTPAPWYCPMCRKENDALTPGTHAGSGRDEQDRLDETADPETEE